MNRFIILITLLLPLTVFSASWYASPTGSGDGSINSPWSIKTALASGHGQSAGDTIYLRGGSYITSGVGSSISGAVGNYVVVASYPGEWATVSDGLLGTLQTTMGTASVGEVTSNVDFSGDTEWYVGGDIIIGTETMQLNGYNSGSGTWNLVRGRNGTSPASHAIGDRALPANSIIQHSGSYVKFQNFGITSILSTNRIVGGTTGWFLGPGLNIQGGVGNKAVGLIVYNTGHPGIGFWRQHDNGELNGCIEWGCGQYDTITVNGDWIRGGGVYAQNDSGSPIIKNNIYFRNWRAGCSMFGSSAKISGFQFTGNASFAPGDTSADAAHFQSDSTPMTNNVASGNFLMPSMTIGYTSQTNRLISFKNNVVVNGTLLVKQVVSGDYTNNIFLIPASATATDNSSFFFDAGTSADKSQLAVTWDYNTYYFYNASHPNQYAYKTKDINATASGGGGNLLYQNDSGKAWKDWSDFDANSTYATAWPTDYANITVQQLDYDTNRWHIAVVNTTTATNTTVNLASSCSFTAGQQYQLRDAQNYFTVIASGVYQGSGTLTLPLYLTNVSAINGTLTHMTNKHTNVDYPGLFNAFVLERLEGSNPVTTRRSSGLRGFSL